MEKIGEVSGKAVSSISGKSGKKPLGHEAGVISEPEEAGKRAWRK